MAVALIDVTAQMVKSRGRAHRIKRADPFLSVDCKVWKVLR